MKKRFRKLIPAILAAAMLLTAAPPAYADAKQPTTVKACFNDVNSSNFYYSLVYWARKEVM